MSVPKPSFVEGDRVQYLINGRWYTGTVESPGDGLVNMAIRLDEPGPTGDIVYAMWGSPLVRLLPA